MNPEGLDVFLALDTASFSRSEILEPLSSQPSRVMTPVSLSYFMPEANAHRSSIIFALNLYVFGTDAKIASSEYVRWGGIVVEVPEGAGISMGTVYLFSLNFL